MEGFVASVKDRWKKEEEEVDVKERRAGGNDFTVGDVMHTATNTRVSEVKTRRNWGVPWWRQRSVPDEHHCRDRPVELSSFK